MKIVTISDSPTLFTGLARVHRHVIDGFLAQGHSVLPCGWFAYNAEQLEMIGRGKTVPPVIYQSPHGPVATLCVPKKSNMNTMYAICEVIAHAKPDIVVTIGDHWDFWYMRAVKIKSGFSFAWLPYLTVESNEMEGKWLRLLQYADAIAVPSAFGKQALSACNKPVHVVEYGVGDVFRPFDGERRRKARLERGCDGKVRFITVALNTWRKNLAAIPQAVEIICHRDPEKMMRFYVHTNVDAADPQETFLYDLKEVASKLGVSDWFEFPRQDRTFSVYSSPDDEYLAEEYNASDFFVLPSMQEGFALPVVEAMACGLPCISNSTSMLPDHLGAKHGQKYGKTKRGFLVSNRTEIYPPSRFIKVIRPDALGQAIWEAFQMARSDSGRIELEGMRKQCSEYGRRRTWADMQEGICGLANSMAGKTKVVIEEL